MSHYDIRVLVKPPTDRDPQWIVNAQRQAHEGSPWESFAQASGDSFAAALRATADLVASQEADSKHWLALVRARLVDDNDAIADVDLLHGLYRALTGDVVPHPYDRGD